MGTRIVFCAVCFVLVVFAGCDTPTNSGNERDIDGPDATNSEPVSKTDWSLFAEIYDELVGRVGIVSSENYTGEVDGGQIASVEYVCKAIDLARDTNYADQLPESEKKKAATVEFLLKMVDKGNDDVTYYWTPYLVNATLPSVASWSSICYGDGKFVAVAPNSDKAAYSSDGIEWTKTALPRVASWSGVCYGGGKFVAVAASSDKAAYSTNGINWTETTLPRLAYLGSVAYGNEKFVAVESAGARVFYSNNGVDWFEYDGLSVAASWRSVVYGNGRFVVVSESYLSAHSNKVAYSTNGGNTWSDAALPSVASWKSICYGDGKFVAVAASSDKAAYSANGIDWTETALPSVASWSSVCYGDGKFVAVATANSRGLIVACSTDGINWVEVQKDYIGWRSVCYGDGKFVAVATSSNKAGFSNLLQVVDTAAVQKAVELLLIGG
jgi:hypothetical protein